VTYIHIGIVQHDRLFRQKSNKEGEHSFWAAPQIQLYDADNVRLTNVCIINAAVYYCAQLDVQLKIYN